MDLSRSQAGLTCLQDTMLLLRLLSLHLCNEYPSLSQKKKKKNTMLRLSELVIIETFGVGKYERFSSWDVTPVTDTVPKTMH